MPNKVTTHRSGRTITDTVVYAPFAWAASDSNSYNRYEAIAQRSRYDVITSHVAGTGKVIIDKSTRRSLASGNIASLVEREAQNAEALTSDYKYRVGLGDSRRGVWIAAMQATGIQPFTHVVLRDAYNAYAPEGLLTGIKRLVQHGSDRGETGASTVPNDPQTIKDKVSNTACGLAEMRNHVRLMCGMASVDAMTTLASQTDTPVHSVTLEYGIGGTSEAVQRYNEHFVELRQDRGPSTGIFKTTHELTWGHGNLLEPDGVIRHISQLLEGPHYDISEL